MKSVLPITWSSNLAYAIGLITTDGCLSKDGRHIDFTSKDLEQIKNFLRALNFKYRITLKSDGRSARKYYRVQFSNSKFYKFLQQIGLTIAKSKTLGRIKIPRAFFADFLRGCLDGDGCIYSYWDTRWKSSFMLYTCFSSASIEYLKWICNQVGKLYGLSGHINIAKGVYQLKYAKKTSVKLLAIIYYKKDLIYLKRKYLKIQQALGIIYQQKAGVEKLVDSLP